MVVSLNFGPQFHGEDAKSWNDEIPHVYPKSSNFTTIGGKFPNDSQGNLKFLEAYPMDVS